MNSKLWFVNAYSLFKLSMLSVLLSIGPHAIFSQINSEGGLIPKLMYSPGLESKLPSLDFRPDGKHVLTVEENENVVKVWDIRSGKIIMELIGHMQRVLSAVYSPDGKRIVTSGRDNTTKIWDATNGRLLININGHKDWSLYSEFSQDGSRILTKGSGKVVKIWDATNGKLLTDLIGHDGSIKTATFSADGNRVITTSIDSTFKIWDVKNGRLLLSVKDHLQGFKIVKLSPTGKNVLSVGNDNRAKLWDANTGKLLVDFHSNISDDVIYALYSPNGKSIAIIRSPNVLELWETSSGKLQKKNQFESLSWLSYVDYSFDGNRIIVGNVSASLIIDSETFEVIKQVEGGNYHYVYGANAANGHNPNYKFFGTNVTYHGYIWDAKTGRLVLELPRGKKNKLLTFSFSPNGKNLIVLYENDKTIEVWDAINGNVLFSLSGHTGNVISARYSPDGKYIISNSHDFTVKLWDASNGKMVSNFSSHTGAVMDVNFSPDMKFIVTAGMDNTAKVWNVASGNLLFTLYGHSEGVIKANFSRDGNLILTASQDSTAKVWDAHSGRLLFTLTGNAGSVLTAIFSPNNKYILTTSVDSIAKVWDVASGNLLFKLSGHSGIILSAAISPDSKILVTTSTDKNIKLWDAENGNVLTDLIGHSLGVTSSQFSPDGKLVLTGSLDNSVKIWDPSGGKLVSNIIGHSGRILASQLSPDGKRICTMGSDGAMKFWEFPSGDLLLTMYPLGREFDWVAIHPSGLFDASPKAMEWMYYLVGQEVIEFEQLKERYYEPGLFKRIMDYGKEGLRDVIALSTLEMYPLIEATIEKENLYIKLKERNGGIGRLSLYINKKEVASEINPNRKNEVIIDLKKYSKFYFQDTINIIGIRAYNAAGWLKSMQYTLEFEPKFYRGKGKMGAVKVDSMTGYTLNYYAIVVGTSDYNGTQLDLRYADKDSKDIAYALQQTANQLFKKENVHFAWFSTDTLSGSVIANKANIRSAFETFSHKARPQDLLIIYFSGHGTAYGGHENEQFYYLTKDVYSGDLSDPGIRESYAISTEELTQWISSIPAQKQVMILDACSSGKVIDNLIAGREITNSQIRAIDRMKDRTGMFVIAGSGADKVSYEASQYGQGLLTYSLLLGMSGLALGESNNIDVMRLFQFARDKVPEFASEIGGVQTPMLAFPTNGSSFDIGLVTDKVEIPLEKVKPIFMRSVFLDENFGDVLRLGEALDEHLITYSETKNANKIIFVNTNRYKNAYSIRGKYTLSGKEVNLDARLFKDDVIVGQINLALPGDNIKNVVDTIMNAVEKIIQQH